MISVNVITSPLYSKPSMFVDNDRTATYNKMIADKIATGWSKFGLASAPTILTPLKSPQSEERLSPKETTIDDAVFVSINFENVDTMRRAVNGDGSRKANQLTPRNQRF